MGEVSKKVIFLRVLVDVDLGGHCPAHVITSWWVEDGALGPQVPLPHMSSLQKRAFRMAGAGRGGGDVPGGRDGKNQAGERSWRCHGAGVSFGTRGSLHRRASGEALTSAARSSTLRPWPQNPPKQPHYEVLNVGLGVHISCPL